MQLKTQISMRRQEQPELGCTGRRALSVNFD